MITISEAQTLGRKFFDINLPCPASALKSAFRLAAKKLHTDVSGHDTKDRFIEMKLAYDSIVELAERTPGLFSEDVTEGETPLVFRKTVDGTPLSELGLGLGPTKNGSDCPVCRHDGYVTEFGQSYFICTECDDNGKVPRTMPCRPCGGTGKFRQARAKHIVTCRACRGSGHSLSHSKYDRQYCPKCRGTKTIYGKTSESFYKKCWSCGGTGEIPVFNPALLKGALHS